MNLLNFKSKKKRVLINKIFVLFIYICISTLFEADTVQINIIDKQYSILCNRINMFQCMWDDMKSINTSIKSSRISVTDVH